MLLVRADVHRSGLIFPPYLYGRESRFARNPSPFARHGVGEVETEGLGMMAKDMGVECWGFPNSRSFTPPNRRFACERRPARNHLPDPRGARPPGGTAWRCVRDCFWPECPRGHAVTVVVVPVFGTPSPDRSFVERLARIVA